jgi:hypothetical protein
MSRGLGELQRMVIVFVGDAARPVTYAENGCRVVARVRRERSHYEVTT